MADEQTFNPVAAARKKWPGLAGWPDDLIVRNLSEPEKFRSAFPEFSSLSDDTIRKNMARYVPGRPTIAPPPTRARMLAAGGRAVRAVESAGRKVRGALPFLAGVQESDALAYTPEETSAVERVMQTGIPTGDLLRDRGVPWLAKKLSSEGVRYDPRERRLEVGGGRHPYIEASVNTAVDLAQLSADTVQGLTTPENVAILGAMALAPEVGVPALAARLVASGVFSAQQAYQAAQQLSEAYQAYRRGDVLSAGRMFASGTTQALFAVLAAKYAAHDYARLGAERAGRQEAWGKFYKARGLPEDEAARAARIDAEKGREAPTVTSETEVQAQEREQRLEAARRQVGEQPTSPSEAVRPARPALMALPPRRERRDRGEATSPEVAAPVTPGLAGALQQPESLVGPKTIGEEIDFHRENAKNLREGSRDRSEDAATRRVMRDEAEDYDHLVAMLEERAKLVGRDSQATGWSPERAVRTARTALPAPAEERGSEQVGPRAERVPEPRPRKPKAAPAPKPQTPAPPAPYQANAAWDEVRRILFPAARGEAAKRASLGLRGALAEVSAKDARARKILDGYRAHFDRLIATKGAAEGLRWIHAYESGRGMENPTEMELASKWRELQTHAWNEVRKREGMAAFIDNYFPHLFVENGPAKEVFSRRPLEGPRSWRFRRTFPTMRDALDWAKANKVDLTPAFENPVDYMTMKLHEMHKYVALHDFVQLMKASGIFRQQWVNRPAPEGMVKLDDPVGTVYGPPRVDYTVREAYDRNMLDQINSFARSLGIDRVRKVNIGRDPRVWGYTIKGVSRVWTKAGGPESVLTHEIGHQLDFRYPELGALVKAKETRAELRRLADLRAESYTKQGEEIPREYRRYIRMGTEKIANLVHAYVHARDRAREVAPVTVARLEEIIDRHPELQALREIRPGLEIGSTSYPQSLEIGGRLIKGYVYAPEPAARIIRNYLRPGLWTTSTLYRGFRYPGNLLNQIQLGTFSFFHFTFTGMDSAASMGSLGLQRLARGDVLGGLKALARAQIVTGPIETYIRGSRVLRQFYGESDYGPAYQQVVNRLISAGGRVTMDAFYGLGNSPNDPSNAFQAFMASWRRGKILPSVGARGFEPGALARTIPAAIEAGSYFVMQHWVPRLKLGTFAMLSEEEMRRLAPDASMWDQWGAMARAWDSVDNRLGQLVYDNVFWDRRLKELLMLTVRSVGWNLGTWRELAGGVLDLKNPRVGGKRGIGPRIAYTVALPVVIGLHGAILGYLLTGKGPESLKDYFFPRTGKKNPDGSEERISIPSYTKDEYAYLSGFRHGIERGLRQVGTLLEYKANPELAIVLQMLRNRDFYGDKIRNEDDPFLAEVKDTAKYIGSQFEPFWLRAMLRRKESEGKLTPGAILQSQFGVMPAPAFVTRTEASSLASMYLDEMEQKSGRTPAQAAQSRLRRQFIQRFRNADPRASADLQEAIRAGRLPRSDRRFIRRATRESYLAWAVSRLGPVQALNVYEAGTPEEQRELRPMLRKKHRQFLEYAGDPSVPEEQRKDVRRRLYRALGQVSPVPARP